MAAKQLNSNPSIILTKLPMAPTEPVKNRDAIKIGCFCATGYSLLFLSSNQHYQEMSIHQCIGQRDLSIHLWCSAAQSPPTWAKNLLAEDRKPLHQNLLSLFHRLLPPQHFWVAGLKLYYSCLHAPNSDPRCFWIQMINFSTLLGLKEILNDVTTLHASERNLSTSADEAIID